jgi:hypothetical protein
MNAGYSLDDLCHARQRPQVGAEPLHPSPLSKSPVHLAKLLRIQSRHPAGTSRSLQRANATTPPLPIPPGDALSAHLQRSRDPSQCAAALRFREQSCRLRASLLQSLEVPPLPNPSFPHAGESSTTDRFVNLLYEIQ